MVEQVIHSILLAMHNVALVGCAAAPFYTRQRVLKRGQYGPKLFYETDKVVEDTLQGNAPYCIVFLVVLWFTGIGMPLNHLLLEGSLREMHTVAIIALVLKLLSVVGMMVIMFIIFLGINPRLREIFAGFSPDSAPDPGAEKEFFALRGRRKALCERCLVLALAVLLSSAFIAFGT